VLELATVLAGPYAGSLLRMLGAEVVKIETPAGDPFRKWSGRADSPHFAQYNVGKKSVVLDLHDPRGVEALKRLLPWFDVLRENSRPGRMDRLGLSSANCAAINPRLVHVSMTGFGSAGPIADRPAYDGVAQAFSGLLSLTNPPGTVPGVSPATGDM